MEDLVAIKKKQKSLKGRLSKYHNVIDCFNGNDGDVLKVSVEKIHTVFKEFQDVQDDIETINYTDEEES